MPFEIMESIVQVKAAVKGRPARGYRVSKISVDPPYITLQGARSQLGGLKEVSTEVVDISGLKETVRVVAPLRIADLRLKKDVKRTATVTVTVKEEHRGR